MNKYQDEESGNETEPREKEVGTGVCSKVVWVCGTAVVNIACPFETDVVEGGVDIFLQKTEIEKINKRKTISG